MSFVLGTRLGPYELVSLIGSGGMGEVYKAHDTRLNRTVAIKVLAGHHAHDSDLRMRFEREARAAAAVGHPNICSVYDIAWQDDVSYIVMEYLEGENLAGRLGRGSLAVNAVFEYAIQIADALREAHRHGVIHRDLKPSNVMLTTSGVKLVDFGVAKVRAVQSSLGSALSTRLPDTEHGTVLGTLQYMAPEQLEGAEVDDRADVFSLGALLYEMLTGAPVFAAESKAGVIAAVLTHKPAEPSAMAPGVPAELDQIVLDCLAKQRDSRPTSDAVVRRLRTVSQSQFDLVAALPSRHRQRHIRSIAVLPVETRLKAESAEAFSEGLTEGLISALARFPALRVISRTSSLRYRHASTPISQIGRELHVDAILAGSVTEDDTGRLSLSAELIDAVAESRLASASHTFNRTDVLRVQEQVADEIAGQIRLSGSNTRGRTRRRHVISRDGHEAYLKARFCFDNRIGDWLANSFEALQTAIKHDREFAPAHAALSRWFIAAAGKKGESGTELGSVDWIDGLQRGEEEARLALQCDPQLGEAHIALGRVMYLRWRFADAEDAFARALAVEPNAAEIHVAYANFLSIIGRTDEAVRHAEKAKELDPLATYVYELLSGTLYAARKFKACGEAAEAGLELSPNSGVLAYFKGQAEAYSGNLTAAAESLKAARLITSDHPATLAALAAVLSKSGHDVEAAGLLDSLVRRGDDPVYFSEICAAMGNVREGLDWLEAAYQQRSPELLNLAVDPAFDPLRTHPRFRRLLRAIGLPFVEVI